MERQTGTVLILALLALTARMALADAVRLDLTTADANSAWVQGRAAPWIVRITGLKRGTARVDCFSAGASYVRAHNVRDGVPAPAVVDLPLRSIPTTEEVSCTAYVDDRWVASWRGTLAWPKMTLPDHKILRLGAKRCGAKWCIDVALDRSHPGAIGADVEVLCTLRHASTERFFVETAPWSRSQVRTTSDRVQLELDNAPGATLIACTVDRGLYGAAQYADADPNNNAATTAVANTSTTKPRIVFVSTAKHATRQPGCGTCSTYMPGAIAVTTRIRNKGNATVDGLGVRCETTAHGTQFQLRGASGPLAAGATQEVSASITMTGDTSTKLVGSLKLRCDAIVWDQPAAIASSWTGTVIFPE